MKTFVALLAGVLLGIAAAWYLPQLQRKTELARSSGTVDVPDGVTNPPSTREGITAEQIKEELARSGRVIREKATKAGEAISDAAANTRISATIKTKLLQDTGLSALNIDVDTSAGVVTLSGTVSSPEQISRAMDLALQTEGVHKVVSTLQLKSN
jgi:hyperosmotically inducible periplasmic protein